MNYFITGTGTDVGKTIVSAVITEALNADYWKPVQSGGLEYTDTQRVKNLISNSKSKFFDEVYLFKQPLSPHAAAKLEGIEIDLEQIKLPQTDNHLVVEGAGGLMVPLNDQFIMLDLIKKFNLHVILVSKNYLGSINHTLLTIEVLNFHQIPIVGIVFNGVENPESERFIAQYSKVKVLGHVDYEDVISKPFVKRNAEKIKPVLLSQKSNLL